MLSGTSNVLGEIQRLCATSTNAFLLDSLYCTFDFGTTIGYLKNALALHYCFHSDSYSLLDTSLLMALCNCNNLTLKAIIRVSLLFPSLCLCQDSATCAQPEVIDCFYVVPIGIQLQKS